MKIIGMSGQKGGTGKTTLSVNIADFFARKGKKVSLLDRDPQQAAMTWFNTGSDKNFEVVSQVNTELKNLVEARSRNGDDIVVIDTAPTVGGQFKLLPVFSDIILLPSRSSLQDIKALSDSFFIYASDSKKKTKHCYGIFTNINKRTKLWDESLRAINELKIPVLNSITTLSISYATSFSEGLSVFGKKEYDKAQLEVESIAKEIISIMK